VRVGKLGRYSLDRGLYLYTGSARGRGSSSLEGRIKRHLSGRKKAFWHIDYLLSANRATVLDVVYSSDRTISECNVNRDISSKINGSIIIGHFGSSDCHCLTHLLRAPQDVVARDLAKQITSIYGLAGTTAVLNLQRSNIRRVRRRSYPMRESKRQLPQRRSGYCAVDEVLPETT